MPKHSNYKSDVITTDKEKVEQITAIIAEVSNIKGTENELFKFRSVVNCIDGIISEHLWYDIKKQEVKLILKKLPKYLEKFQ